MSIKTLKEYITEAEENKVAIGHFNFATLEMLRGIFNAARKLNVPVIVGVSEGERNFVGIKQARVLVNSLQEEFGYPIFLNADHTYSLEKVEEAINADFDAVIFDGAALQFDENIKITRKCVDYAKEEGLKTLIEGELGFIGKSSKLLDKIPEGAQWNDEMLTKPEEAEQFVKETGVNLFAPAVGNIHGMLKAEHNPKINISRIAEIREAAGVPLVLHGGSGITDHDFGEAIRAGISVVHISTEIRVAYKKEIQKSLSLSKEDLAPYRYLKSSVQAVENVVLKRLKLFNNL